MAHTFELQGDPIQHFDGRGCEFVVVIRDEDPNVPAHAETVYCKADHAHTKKCAQDLMTEKPVVGSDAGGNLLYGRSPKERAEAWLAGAKGARKPETLALPTKKAKDENGKSIDVPDKGLSLK